MMCKMIIPNVDFELSTKGSYYHNNTIYFGLLNGHKLTDDELIKFITDTITHEYIHHILRNIFSEIVSCLFDAIGDKIRRVELARKVTADCEDLNLWSDRIAKDGINVLIDDYELNRNEVDKILKEGC